MKETRAYNEPSVHRMVLRYALVIGLIILAAQLPVLLRVNLTGIGLFALAAIPAVGLVGIELALEPIARVERRRNLEASIENLKGLLARNAPIDEVLGNPTARKFTDTWTYDEMAVRGYRELEITPEKILRLLTGTFLEDYISEPPDELRIFAANIIDNPLPLLSRTERAMILMIGSGASLSRLADYFRREPIELRNQISRILLRYLQEPGAAQSKRRTAAKQE